MKKKDKLTKREMNVEVISLLQKYSLLKLKKERFGTSLESEEEDFYNLITKSLNILTELEHQVLTTTYIDNEEEKRDYVILNELCLSRRSYYRIKDSGLQKLYNIIPHTLFSVS